MARFDIYPYSESVPFVMDVQGDLLSGLQTRVVIPLLPEAEAKKEVLAKLKPVISVNGENYILVTTDIGVLRTAELKKPVANAEAQRHCIMDAIDFLFQGY